MLMQRLLAAVTLGVLTVSALPGRCQQKPVVVTPEPEYGFGIGAHQEPLAHQLWGNGVEDPVLDFPPHFPHRKPDDRSPDKPDASKKTIYQFLKEDKQFTRLFKLVNFTDEITNTLNDSSASLTLFAPPDTALRPPKRHGHHRAVVLDGNLEDLLADESLQSDPLEALAVLDELVSDDHDDHKKEILKRIVGAILSYHILPHSLLAADLVKNTTFGTSYTPRDGAFDGKPLRITVYTPFRVLHPVLAINFYAKVVTSDVKATNGIIHITNNPVLPPPAIFQELFLFSDHFSTFTSAIQRVGLTDAADWRYVPGEGHEKGTIVGSPSLTIFAPTNGAFKKLPWKLRLFLFSPFGEKVLTKLIKFHIVPDVILHSDYFHNATDSVVQRNAEPECCMDAGLNDLRMFDLFGRSSLDMGHHLKELTCFNTAFEAPRRLAPVLQAPPVGEAGKVPHPEPIYAHTINIPTLFTNHTLHVHVAQYEHRSPLPPHRSSYFKKVVANGVVAKVADVPARNGAVHVVDKVLNPFWKKGDHHHHHGHGGYNFKEIGPGAWVVEADEEDEWAGWEDWLVQWAEEN